MRAVDAQVELHPGHHQETRRPVREFCSLRGVKHLVCKQELGWPLPEEQEYYALALVCLAGLCGLGRVHEHAPSEEEFEVVGEAVSNADRYYQLVTTSTTQRREDADQASRAFKITAAVWFEQKTVGVATTLCVSVSDVHSSS